MTTKELYYELSRIYSCRYADRPEEIERAYVLLYEAISSGETTAAEMLRKMRQLKARNADGIESRLYTHIESHFWEKTYVAQYFKLRPFKPE